MKNNFRTYAFIDASNIIYGAKAEGWFIDHQKLYDYLVRKFQVSKAFFYSGKDSNNETQKKFFEELKRFGYILRTKEIKRFGKRIKANCDVDLTMDMLIRINEYDKAVVLSGDGDFAPLLKYLQNERNEIFVIASPKRTAREIRVWAKGKLLSLEDLRYLIEYKK